MSGEETSYRPGANSTLIRLDRGCAETGRRGMRADNAAPATPPLAESCALMLGFVACLKTPPI